MNINVNFEELKQTAKTIQNYSEQYEQTIQSMYSRVQELQTIWKGADNQAFVEQMQSFRPELNRLKDVIQQYSHFLNTSATAYETLQKDRITNAKRLL